LLAQNGPTTYSPGVLFARERFGGTFYRGDADGVGGGRLGAGYIAAVIMPPRTTERGRSTSWVKNDGRSSRVVADANHRLRHCCVGRRLDYDVTLSRVHNKRADFTYLDPLYRHAAIPLTVYSW